MPIRAPPNYYCNGVGTPGTGLPNCDIYFNKNISHDRQIAGFGEVTYSLTDQWKLTAGGRFAKMQFNLQHYANGLENSGLGTFSGSYQENTFTPKASVSYQYDPHNLYYATYAKGFRPGGVNAPLPYGVCGPTPNSFNSDTTQSYEIGAKNNIDNRYRIASSVYYIKWNNIQQNIYDSGPTGGCGFQYTSNLGTAVAKGFDLQADAELWGGLSIEATVGYTSARYTKDSPLVTTGDAISGEAAINYSPGTNAPWNVAIGPQYNFSLGGLEAFVRADWNYASRNNWLASVQDPNSTQFNQYSYTLPSSTFTSLRAGFKLGAWQVSAFVDNLTNTHPVLNYALVQNDYNNPAGPPPPQENDFTYRPRTVGITATFKN